MVWLELANFPSQVKHKHMYIISHVATALKLDLYGKNNLQIN